MWGLGLELPGLGLDFYDKVSVSSRNLSQVSVSEVTVSTKSLLHSFTIIYTVIYSQGYKIYFLYFINWLNAGALLQLADAGGIGHIKTTISLN